ncbi:MAG: hypothetical protein V8R48_10385 [Eggerthella lenta]
MFRQSPIIETKTDAVDELADVRMTLSGLASLTQALANSGMHEPDAMRLTSCLLDYCALTTEAASDKFDEAPRDTTRPDRLS